MSNVESPPEVTHEARRERITRRVKVAGSTAGALLGLTAIVLSIFALAGLLVLPLTAVAVITVGAALLVESASVASRPRIHHGEATRAIIFGGVGADTITAMAAVTLGVLSLIGIAPLTLLPVSILVLGAGLLFSGATALVERVRAAYESPRAPDIADDAASAAAGAHMLVGAGSLVLGILAVLSTVPLLLTLIATLSLGISLLLSGVALGTRTLPPVQPAA
ncbi:MAG TPA: hypothetical protein VM925_23740 [Labilithrix sp.]|nr:hypothetical protein [Labilithrix sp.]